ncbi:uncharacterized protein ACNFOS_010885 [Eudromia elegans]
MAAAGGAARRGLLKRKPNFTLQELEILMSEVLKHEQLLFGAAASTVNAYEKQKIWWRITNKVNAAGRNQRDIGEVKNRWRGLRRRAGDNGGRQRQERQAPPARALGAGTGTGTGTGEPPGSQSRGLLAERDAERDGRRVAGEQRLARAQEQLAQEVRAFRREYAESRRETAAALRAIAEALAALGSGLRQLCARAPAGPAP